ncbi:MAG: CYTH domain-containing protein [Planctomycetota bacterium]|nr:CYTH domain-containing protein [Planctomycetota bacterium]
MGREIEHRFLVRHRALPRRLPAGDRIVQGFLSFEPVVRVRLRRPLKGGATRAWLTIKGGGLRVRAEYEYGIPLADARRMLKLCGDAVIEKVRICHGPWEIDRFLGRHRGLWVAELEMPNERARLPDPLPEWIGREVTEDPRYTNSNLARARKWPPSRGFLE